MTPHAGATLTRDGRAVGDIETRRLVQAGDPRTSQVRPVDQGHGVHGAQDRQEAEIELASVLIRERSSHSCQSPSPGFSSSSSSGNEGVCGKAGVIDRA